MTNIDYTQLPQDELVAHYYFKCVLSPQIKETAARGATHLAIPKEEINKYNPAYVLTLIKQANFKVYNTNTTFVISWEHVMEDE